MIWENDHNIDKQKKKKIKILHDIMITMVPTAQKNI